MSTTLRGEKSNSPSDHGVTRPFMIDVLERASVHGPVPGSGVLSTVEAPVWSAASCGPGRSSR